MKFEVIYSFNGNGTVIIEADNKKEALELFSEGEYKDADETRTQDYDRIEVVK